MSSIEKRIKKMFQAPKKGETFELRAGLVSQYANERKDAIKQVIAAMTVGKDVSALFPDVLKNIATHDLKQKKLVYLYLMNYAKTNPELSILAMNTFVQDTEDPNPLVRALAIRTMGCIRVDKMVDYMQVPLNRTLNDENPYVRKTAAICVAKLFELNKEICIENGFLDKLKSLVEDSNPMVVANSISALSEIHESDPALEVLTVTPDLLERFLVALNECTEWGRIAILTELAEYEPLSSEEAKHIIERVVPQLQHSNPSVVLSSIKVILNNIGKFNNNQEDETLLKKLCAPLVSLVSTPPEVQYIALRNIRIIIEKYPELLENYFRVFFVRFNDPLYLKLEKIEIIVRLSTEKNASLILNELKEYGYEFDIEFVRRSVKAISQVGIKLPKYHKKAVELLINLVNERELYNEGVVSLKDLLRSNPAESQLILPTIVQNQDKLTENESISSLIWVLGEYNIPGFQGKLKEFIDSFNEYDVQVQSTLIYSIVKIYIKTNDASLKTLIDKVFNDVDNIENIEIKDSIAFYTRILQLNTAEQKKILLSEFQRIDNTISYFNPELLEFLIRRLSTLNSVFFTTGETSASDKKLTQVKKMKDIKLNVHNNDEALLDFDDEEEESEPKPSESINILDELNDLFSSSTIQPAPASAPVSGSANKSSSTSNSISNNLLDLF